MVAGPTGPPTGGHGSPVGSRRLGAGGAAASRLGVVAPCRGRPRDCADGIRTAGRTTSVASSARGAASASRARRPLGLPGRPWSLGAQPAPGCGEVHPCRSDRVDRAARAEWRARPGRRGSGRFPRRHDRRSGQGCTGQGWSGQGCTDGSGASSAPRRAVRTLGGRAATPRLARARALAGVARQPEDRRGRYEPAVLLACSAAYASRRSSESP